MTYTQRQLSEARDQMMKEVNLDVYESIIKNILNSSESTSACDYNPRWLEAWASAKAPLYLEFGGRLKVTKEIDTQVEAEECREIALRFCEEDFAEDRFLLVREVFKSIVGAKAGYDMQRKRYDDGGENTAEILSNISMEDIANNSLSVSVTLFNKKYQRGNKITSLLRDLVKREDRESFDIIYSRFLQSLSAKGLMSVSIDPIDFLTMSENKSNWSSCHNLQGEYKAGVVSYMLDPHTTVSYVQNSELVEYRIAGGHKWNSKKWRQIVFVDPEHSTFAQSRQYPSDNKGFNDGVYEILTTEVFPDTDFKKLSSEEGTVGPSNSGWVLDEVEGGGEELHYNDLIHYSCKRTFAFPKDMKFEDVPSIYVGAEVECICGCGEYVEACNRLHSPCHYDEDEYY